MPRKSWPHELWFSHSFSELIWPYVCVSSFSCFIPVLVWISFLSQALLVLLYSLDPFVPVGPPQGLSFPDTSIILKPFTFQLTPVVTAKSNHVFIGFFFFWKLFQYFVGIYNIRKKRRWQRCRERHHLWVFSALHCFVWWWPMANSRHTGLSFTYLFLPGPPSWWKVSPCTNIPFNSIFWSSLEETGMFFQWEKEMFLFKPRWKGNGAEECGESKWEEGWESSSSVLWS